MLENSRTVREGVEYRFHKYCVIEVGDFRNKGQLVDRNADLGAHLPDFAGEIAESFRQDRHIVSCATKRLDEIASDNLGPRSFSDAQRDNQDLHAATLQNWRVSCDTNGR